MEPSVRIMMATYNGAPYIEEQIMSLMNQTFKRWSLIIQDDGSTDGTYERISEILRQFPDSRIELQKNRSMRHGAYYNFHSIANQEKQKGSKYTYYMFCDQDDIWDADKIEKMVRFIGRFPSELPAFCYGDMRVINGKDELISSSICQLQGLLYYNWESLFFSHIIYGCNVIMNTAAFYAVPIIDLEKRGIGILSHDNLYAKFSGVFGTVHQIPEVLMTYRRHEGNVTSKQQYGFGLKRLINRVFHFKSLAEDHALTYSQSLMAIRLMQGRCDKKDLASLERTIRNGGWHALRYVRKKHINWGKPVKNISRGVVLFTKAYQPFLNLAGDH